MRNKSILLCFAFVAVFSSVQCYGATGQGISTWPALADPVADADLIAGTDVSDTTDSDSGSTVKITAAQLKTYMGVSAKAPIDDPAFTTKITAPQANIGAASTTTGLLNFYNSGNAYPVGLFSVGASAPSVGYRLTGTMPSEASVWVFDTSGYASWTAVSSLGGSADIVQTVDPTGTGESTKVPSEVAVGDALELKQDVSDVVEAAVDGTTLQGAIASGGDNDGKYVIGVTDGGIGPTQLSTEANTNSIQYVYVDTTETETTGLPVRIPTDAAWTNAYSSCNGNESALVYTLERATTLGGTMSSLGAIAHNAGGKGDTVDISAFTDPSSGDWVQVRITTAATTATACTLAIELVSN